MHASVTPVERFAVATAGKLFRWFFCHYLLVIRLLFLTFCLFVVPDDLTLSNESLFSITLDFVQCEHFLNLMLKIVFVGSFFCACASCVFSCHKVFRNCSSLPPQAGTFVGPLLKSFASMCNKLVFHLLFNYLLLAKYRVTLKCEPLPYTVVNKSH